MAPEYPETVNKREALPRLVSFTRTVETESSTVFEYNKFEPKPEDRNTIRKAVSTPTYIFEKKIYPHYHSAEIHTVKRKIPFKLLMVPFILILAVATGWYAITNLMDLFSTDKELLQEASDQITGSKNGEEESLEKVYINPVEKWIAMRTPVIEGMPWTAPMFKDVQDVKTFPKPHCVIHSMEDESDMGKCVCYSQQITKIQNVNESVCRQLASEGWFDYTLDTDSRGQDRAPPGLSPARKPRTLVRDRRR